MQVVWIPVLHGILSVDACMCLSHNMGSPVLGVTQLGKALFPNPSTWFPETMCLVSICLGKREFWFQLSAKPRELVSN